MTDTGDRANALSKILNGAATFPAPAEEDESDALTVAQMDGNYSTMRPANKILTRLHVILKDGKIRSYQYVFLNALSTFEGGSFTLLFVGVKHWSLTVKGHGPNLWRLYDLCTLHRLPYLREATGSMPAAAGDGETVLTSIEVRDVTPRERE